MVTLGTAAMEQDRAAEAIGNARNDLEALRTGLVEAQAWARGVGPA